VVLDEVNTNNRAALAGCSILTTPSRVRGNPIG
jgi:hypothetical protein